MRVSTDGGATYDAGNHYTWATMRWIYAASSYAGSTPASSMTLITGSHELTNIAAFGGVNGRFTIASPLNGATAHPGFYGQFNTYFDVGPLTMGTNFSGNYLALSAVNAFQLYMSTGNISSGTVRVYGVEK